MYLNKNVNEIGGIVSNFKCYIIVLNVTQFIQHLKKYSSVVGSVYFDVLIYQL